MGREGVSWACKEGRVCDGSGGGRRAPPSLEPAGWNVPECRWPLFFLTNSRRGLGKVVSRGSERVRWRRCWKGIGREGGYLRAEGASKVTGAEGQRPVD